MNSIIRFLVLPSEISEFERRYLARLNRVALVFFALHVPAFALLAWANGTGPVLAASLSAFVLAGPIVARSFLTNPRHVSVVFGMCAMFMGGLLVHFGQGPMQIEMHFYFFALIAMCAVFGNPMVVVAAATTVALHHVIVWLALPASVFNYDAGWTVVAVHAGFVVLESVATCFIARSFFDNVIGLEKIVEKRTLALDAKNQDMRLLLDNMDQGFLRIDRDGNMGSERSRAIEQWFGAFGGESWFDYLATASPSFGASTRLAWEQVADGFMPPELTLEQLPHRLHLHGATLHIEVRPIGTTEPHTHYLVVVTDVTSAVEREQAEIERREAMAVFERVLCDRSSFETFFEEGSSLIEALTSDRATDLLLVKRLIHTLKGNASLFGLFSVASLCHQLEDVIEDHGALPPKSSYQGLCERWARLTTDVEKLLGSRSANLQIDDAQFESLLHAVEKDESRLQLLDRVRGLKLEPTAKRLGHFAEQARRIAERLEKGEVDVVVEDNGVRLDSKRWAGFWSSFIHAIRNSVDHGIETSEERVAAGKLPRGHIELRTALDHRELVIEIVDDGRGIDWEAIAEKATRLGIPRATQTEVETALFATGLTTATTVSDVSGRGIGMGSLLEATNALGGKLVVESKRGEGTRIRMSFPNGRSCVPKALASAA